MKNIRSIEDAMRHLDELAAEISGKKADPSAEAKKQAAVYNAAFWEHMHTGMPQNGLKAGSDGAGGYLVPDTYDTELAQALAVKNAIRQVAKSISTTQKMHIPVASGIGDAAWIREGEPWGINEAGFGEVVLDAYKLATAIRVSDEMLEDSGVDIEEYIRKNYAERIGKAEEDAFIRGNGKGKPLGLVYQAAVGATTADEGDISLDDIIDLEHSVSQPYRQHAVWLMSEDAYGRLRRIRHYDGRPLWNNNLQEGEPEYLFGYRIYVCKSMDNVVPGGIPVMFGDFKHFWIGDRGKRVIKRLVERYADRGQVAFITTERVDAKLVLPDAIKMLKVSGTPVEESNE